MVDIEVWKEVLFYPKYLISNLGRVKSITLKKWNYLTKKYNIKETKIIKLQIVSSGYYGWSGYNHNGKKLLFVHKEIMKSFVGQKPLGMEVRHLDGNSFNNNINNLCYSTKKENQQDRLKHGTHNRGSKSGKAKVNEKQVLKIVELRKQGLTQKEIANIFNISRENVGSILNPKRKEWKWLIGGIL